MSHVAIGGLKLTANQLRCQQLPKYRASITCLKHEEVRKEEEGAGAERGRDGQRREKERGTLEDRQNKCEKKAVERTGD